MPGVLRRPLVAGNWKMNGLRASVAELGKILEGAGELSGADVLVCPPATLICEFAAAVGNGRVRIGGQDCHPEPAGAFTGDISAEMLRDAGASAVIVGHSERRTYHNETDALVRIKALAARRAGLTAIVCVGESRAQRESGSALSVVAAQLNGSLPDEATPEDLIVAYEPVWAIGTGLTPTPADVAEMHGHIRRQLVARFGDAMQKLRVLYGGSVKGSNAQELMRVTDVDGALVGGASLQAQEFLGIAGVYR
ncbi:MAG: triose-phosphate isomerase [Alphaproteobacteria bacterium]|nr:MAG: triose-phosphate isomerase [Alphaproteobacteria bacterium]